MHEHEVTEPPTDDGDETLDGFETDLDNVAGALDALDADDLDTAEALVAGLGGADEDVAASGDADDAPDVDHA